MASELPCVEQEMTVMLPDDSSECSTQSGCVYEKRSINAETLMRYCNILAVLYLVCSVITFGSSAYTGDDARLCPRDGGRNDDRHQLGLLYHGRPHRDGALPQGSPSEIQEFSLS